MMRTQHTIFTMMITIILMTSFSLSQTGCKEKNQDGDSSALATGDDSDQTVPPDSDILTAAYMGDLEAVRQHIRAGSDLNVRDEYGSTPLLIATTFGRTDVALALIEAGADLELRNADGSTALHTAVLFCRKEIVKALLENGADPQAENGYGSTALEIAEAPFDRVKPVYDQLSRDLGPFGLKLDYTRIEKTRPEIAALLKK